MFDELSGVDDPAVVDVMAAATRDEAVPAARRFAAIAELLARHSVGATDRGWSIHVVAEPTTVSAPPHPTRTSTASSPDGWTPRTHYARRLTPSLPGCLPSAQIPCLRPALAALIAAGARTAPIGCPEPTPGYPPSAALARFLRARDMTCRFPGCELPG